MKEGRSSLTRQPKKNSKRKQWAHLKLWGTGEKRPNREKGAGITEENARGQARREGEKKAD